MQNVQPLLRLEHVSKAFDGRAVLDDISLTVNRGEVVCILGPSGSGKSTLLRCATLLDRFDAGSMYYDELAACTDEGSGKAQYASKGELALIEKKRGLVFQDFNLFPHYSALQNVTDPLVIVQRKTKDEAHKIALDLFEKLDLLEQQDLYPYQLSGGQKQRVAIARALALDPEILFFDEPTSALDPELTQEILRVIKMLAAEHMTMMIVTHEIDFARAVADQVIFMDKGVVVEAGSAESVIDNPQNERTRAFLTKLAAD